MNARHPSAVRPIMLRFLLLLPPIFTLAAEAPKELTGKRAPAEEACPTVEEATARMKVPPGFAVRPFAAEPMVINPVAMTWDGRGRLWVVELYEYPSGAKTPPVYSRPGVDTDFRPVDPSAREVARDRVVILEDTDNDGAADKRTVFVDGLNLATALLHGDGGLYVGQTPNLLFFRDTNGDDVADEWKTVLTGFGREDTHELLNAFAWGPDGWLYFTHGVFTHSRVRRPGEPPEAGVKLNAGVGRVKPRTGEFEVFADGTSNPWGVDFDAAGNAFVSACVIDHLFHLAPGGLYHRQGGAPEYPYAFELLPSIVKHKHKLAAYAGIAHYDSFAYPDSFRGHLYIGNIHDNAIHQEKISPQGSSFLAEPVRDFLRAESGWFRPVSTQVGPDGNLWIMDWCDKYPCYQNAQANPGGVDRERGRIWRVVFHGGDAAAVIGSREKADLDLDRTDSAQLIFAQQRGNQWQARYARRLLQERADPSLLPMLGGMVEHMKGNPGRLPALWTLIGSGLQPPLTLLEKLAADEDATLRLWTARWIGERRAVAALPVLERLAADPEASVRLAVAVAARQFAGGMLTLNRPGLADAAELPVTAALIRHSPDIEDRPLALLIWTALQPRLESHRDLALALLAALPESAKPLAEILVEKSVRMLCDRRDRETLAVVFRWIDTLSDPWVQGKAVGALVRAQEAGPFQPAQDTSAALAAWMASPNERLRSESRRLATLWGDPAAVRGLMEEILREETSPEARVKALQTVGKLRAESARAGLVELLGRAGGTDAEVEEAVRAAALLGGAEFPPLLLRRWARASPRARAAAAEALLSREDWALSLLEALAPGAEPAVDPATLPQTVRRHFGRADSPILREKAQAVLGIWQESDADTRALLTAKRKAVLEGTPDLARGRDVFTASCATCHVFLGQGVAVGPDLTGSGRSNLDALLTNLIAPNQIIGRGYENTILKTRDGRELAGRIVEDTPGQVRLLGIGGLQQVVARDQIASLVNTGQSLMPMGFGALPDDVLRDLVWFVLAPPEEGPLTAEKREALARGVDGTTPPPDGESVALWNPDWRLDTVPFEGTPSKLPEFQGRLNVLKLHPKDRQTPCALERDIALPADRDLALRVWVAAHAPDCDWELRVTVEGREVHRQVVDAQGGRWRDLRVPLPAEHRGRTVRVRLENWPNGWKYEFSYWSDLRLE
jgi:putative membrane-bound dehydrogenase-like protein